MVLLKIKTFLKKTPYTSRNFWSSLGFCSPAVCIGRLVPATQREERLGERYERCCERWRGGQKKTTAKKVRCLPYFLTYIKDDHIMQFT